MSPTQRTQAYLRKAGMLVAHAERKMPATAKGWHGLLITQDLFGLVDTVALDPTAWQCPLCIQTTSQASYNEHWKRIMEHENTATLLRHVRLELWTWGKEKHRWKLRRERFGLHANGRVFSWPSMDPLNL